MRQARPAPVPKTHRSAFGWSDQMNALYGAHPAFAPTTPRRRVRRHVHAGASADALSSAAFLKGAPTPLVFVFPTRARAGRARHPPFDRPYPRHGDQVPSRDGSEADIICISANGFPWHAEDFLALLQRPAQRSRRAQADAGRDVLSAHPAALAFVTTPAVRSAMARSPSSASMLQVHQCARREQVRPLRSCRERPRFVSDEEARSVLRMRCRQSQASLEKAPVKSACWCRLPPPMIRSRCHKVWPDSRPTVELGEIAVVKP